MKFYELGRSFFRKMVQIRSNFVTTCTIKGTRGAKLQENATFSGSLEKSLDKVVSRGEKNFSVHKKYMNFFQYRKTALDEHLYKLSAGRSMVEMLGVLAIIGVLSVGAIAGYSKAMMKYKLNKQAEQLNTLFSIMGIYKSQWKFSQTTYLKDYYVKIGLIPEEMNKDATSYLYDIFNNKILLRNNGAPTYEQTVMQIYLTNSFADNFAICQNIINIAQSHNDSLYAFMVAYTDNDNMEGESGIIYGNDSCQYNRKCIKDIKLNDINNYCQLCNDKASCCFNFVWSIK